MKFVVGVCIGVLLGSGCSHLPAKLAEQQAKLQSFYDPTDLGKNLVNLESALYIICPKVFLTGEFYQPESGESKNVLLYSFYGNGFAIDDHGSIITNAHVASPEVLLWSALQEMAKEKLAVRQLSKAGIIYQVQSADGRRYFAQYEMTAKWLAPLNKFSLVAVAVSNFHPVVFEKSTRVRVLYSDKTADLALLSVPAAGTKYLTLGKVGDLSKNAELYNYALNVEQAAQGNTPELEVRYGLLQVPCSWVETDIGIKHMVAKVTIYSKAGKSGSPYLNTKGEVVGISQSYQVYGLGANIVPAEYITKFYRFVTGQDPLEPILNCAGCGLEEAAD